MGQKGSKVQGEVSAGYESVRDIFQQNFEWVKQHHLYVLYPAHSIQHKAQRVLKQSMSGIFALIHISHIHLIISIFFPYQPPAVSTSHSLQPIDLMSFYHRLIILISTGREDSAQLCVYVGGEKVVKRFHWEIVRRFLDLSILVVAKNVCRFLKFFSGGWSLGQQKPCIYCRYLNHCLFQVCVFI